MHSNHMLQEYAMETKNIKEIGPFCYLCDFTVFCFEIHYFAHLERHLQNKETEVYCALLEMDKNPEI